MPSMTTLTSLCAGAQTRKLVASPMISAPIGRRSVLDVFAKTVRTAASVVRVMTPALRRMAHALLFFKIGGPMHDDDGSSGKRVGSADRKTRQKGDTVYHTTRGGIYHGGRDGRCLDYRAAGARFVPSRLALKNPAGA